MKKTVVLGFLGAVMDEGRGKGRWEKWRPSLSLCQQEDLLIDTDDLVQELKTAMEGAEDWEDRYRSMWKWDKVTWGSHCVDCYPTNCPYRVYSRNGRVIREEPSGHFGTVEKDVPDMNPAGCQKGASWSQMLDGKERILHPLRRAGERGEGRWNRVSWDEALTEIADAMLERIVESEGLYAHLSNNPQSVASIEAH